MIREDLINTLPDLIGRELGYGVGSDLKPAFLGEYSLSGEQKPLWYFYYDPTKIETSYDSEGSFGEALGVNVQPYWFKYNLNRTLTLPNLLFWGFGFGKHFGTVIEGLEALRSIDKDSFSPKVLTFVWGSRNFGPCLLKKFEITENMWDSDGNIVAATANIELIEIPDYQVDKGRDLSVPVEIIPKLTPEAKAQRPSARNGSTTSSSAPQSQGPTARPTEALALAAYGARR